MHSGPFSCGGEYIEQQCEAEFRAEHLPEFIRQARVCFWAAMAINLVFVLSDWRFYGQTHFYIAIAARAVIVITSLACLAPAARAHSFRRFQFVCVAWALFVIPACAVLVSPHTDIALLVTFVLPALFYLGLPVCFGLALLFGFGTSVYALGAYMSPHFFSDTSLGLVLGMLLGNVVSVLLLIHSNRLRRLEWSATRAQRVANQELSEQRDMLQKILQAIPTPLLLLSKDGSTLLQANDAAYEYFGAKLQEGPVAIDSYIDRRDLVKLAMKLRSEGQVTEYETRLRLPDGSAKDVLLGATTVAVAGTDAVLAVLVDITHRKEVEMAMKRMANTDPLSHLPNRTRFFSVAAYEIKRAQQYKHPLAVFMVDIDFFKQINDTHGHEVGDLALKAFAGLCRSWVRRQDIVARLGGEEFGFLLPETNALSALVLAERLRAAVEGLRIDRLLRPITISIGVAEVQPGETAVDSALSRADQALYAAKKAGRNRVALYNSAKFASRTVSRS
jgi:diguanylate cyclase (GGDEF)-like protein